jgi:hypothetical protein
MTNSRFGLFRSSAVAAGLLLGLTAAAHSGPEEGGCAILPPYESPDPPGYNSANGDIDRKGGFYPYYSPLAPISVRWGYKELIPYYPGYHRKGKHGVTSCGSAGMGYECAAEAGVALDLPPGVSFDYGRFTGGTGSDDNRFWRMGGNGLVPYGAAPPPRPGPDLIDLLEGRQRRTCP